MSQDDVLNPIVGQSVVSWLSAGDPNGSQPANTTVVYLADPNVTTVARLGRPPAIRERLRRSYWRYEVDIAHHWTSLSLALPAREEAFFFTVRINLTWNVHDPVAVARAGIHDVRPIIWGFLDQQLRGISRGYGIEQAGSAEQAMVDFLERKLGDVDYGLRLALVSVNVRPDGPAKAYLATRVESLRARALAEDDHGLETLRRRHAAEQARRQGDLEREQAAHAAEIERMRADQDHKLADQAAVHELALKGQRVDFYRNALRGGGYDVLVLHLIEHPQDVQAVLQLLHQGHKDQYERARTILQNLLDNGLINAGDAEPMREHAIDLLRSAFDSAPPTVTVTNETSTRLTAESVESAERTSIEMPLT